MGRFKQQGPNDIRDFVTKSVQSEDFSNYFNINLKYSEQPEKGRYPCEICCKDFQK